MANPHTLLKRRIGCNASDKRVGLYCTYRARQRHRLVLIDNTSSYGFFLTVSLHSRRSARVDGVLQLRRMLAVWACRPAVRILSQPGQCPSMPLPGYGPDSPALHLCPRNIFLMLCAWLLFSLSLNCVQRMSYMIRRYLNLAHANNV